MRSLLSRALGFVAALGLALAPITAPAASLTPPNLTAQTSIANNDLFLVWPTASSGPLKQIQWSVLQSQMQTALGSTYLQVSNNLSDVASVATARNNLGLGTAALANTGTAGHTIPFADGTVTISSPWTWSASLTTAASATGGAGFTLTPGVAPTSPVNGNLWLTSSVITARINGVSQNLLLSGNNLSDVTASTARTNLGLGTAAVVNTGSSGATLPLLNAANTWSAVQTFNANDLLLGGVTGATQCLHVNSTGVVTGTGTDCGTGSGSVGTTGSPASGNLTKFSGTSTITNGDLSGDCTTSGTLAIICTKTNSVAFGTFATANAATPPAIGGTTPAAGAFTTLSASSTVSGSGFSTYLASPPAIGGTAAAAGSFTTLSDTSGLTTTRAAIGATSTDGELIQNTTAAALSAQQWSPRTHWSGRGWQTNTSSSQAVDIIAEVQPVQGAAAPTGNFVISQSINAGAYGVLLTLPTGGGLNLNSGTYQIGGTQIACANLSNGAASCSTDTTNAANISSGTLAAARGGAGTITGALKANGSGVVSQAACADLSNGTTACSTAIGTSGATLPLLNGTNTWSSTQTFPAASLTLSELATQSAATIVANTTGGSASPTAVTITSLQGTTSSTFAAGNDSRFVGPTQNSQSAAYTFVIGDGGGQIYHPSADTTARTWTIPANSSVAYQVGAKIELINDCSAGVITLNITTDTLTWFPAGTTGSRSIAACGAATLTKVTSTKWVITGVGISYLDRGSIPAELRPANDNHVYTDDRAFG